MNGSSLILLTQLVCWTPSVAGLFQETDHIPFLFRAWVFFCLRPAEQFILSSGVPLPESGYFFLWEYPTYFFSAPWNVLVTLCSLQVCGSLREACVVFAGPFSAGFSEKDVSRLFRCCGPVQKVKMLKSMARVWVNWKLVWILWIVWILRMKSLRRPDRKWHYVWSYRYSLPVSLIHPFCLVHSSLGTVKPELFRFLLFLDVFKKCSLFVFHIPCSSDSRRDRVWAAGGSSAGLKNLEWTESAGTDH